MNLLKLPFSLLFGWSIISLVIIVIGIGMAGGVSNAFSGPPDYDVLSILIWVFACGLVFLPFILILMKLMVRSNGS